MWQKMRQIGSGGGEIEPDAVDITPYLTGATSDLIAPPDLNPNMPAYAVFDKTSRCWYYTSAQTIGYNFHKNYVVKVVKIKNREENNTQPPKEFYVVGKNSGDSSWHRLHMTPFSCTDRGNNAISTFELPNNKTSYECLGVETVSMYDNQVWINEIEFWAYEK